MRSLIAVLAVVAVAAAGLAGVRIALRNLRLSEVQSTTGVKWPKGSELVEFVNDEGLKSAHTTVTVRVANDERAALLLRTPALTTTSCQANSPSAFWSHRSAEGFSCLEGHTASLDGSTSWRVMFNVNSGELIEQVDWFY